MSDPHAVAPSSQQATRPKYWQSHDDLFPLRIRDVIENGLHPNTSWTESEIVCPMPKSGCVLPNVPEEDEAWFHWSTPFHRAVWLRQFDIAEFLLEAGANVDIRNAFGRTALHEAVDRGQPETILFLVKHRADLEAPTLNAKVYWEDMECFVCGMGDLLPLHLALANSRIDIMEMLLDAGAKRDHLSESQYCCLDLALLARDRRAVSLLRRYGAEFSRAFTDHEEQLPEYKALARSFLEFAASDGIIPPFELLPVFTYALKQVDPSNYLGKTLDSAGGHIDGLFRQLYFIAGLEMKAPPNDLCHRCTEFQLKLRYYCETSEKDKLFPFRLHDHRMDLRESAATGCSLCCLLADALDKAWSGALHETRIGKEKDVKLDGAVYLTMTLDNPWIQELTISCNGVTKTMEIAYLEDDLISGSSLPPRHDLLTSSESAFHTAKQWLKACKSSPSHSGCQEFARAQATSKKYPARLINVGSDDRTPFLVEGVDESMPYMTLSYCRGEHSTDLSSTTRANVDSFKRSIEIDTMPAIIRDAITTAKHLNLHHLWVDILCIIQDDPDDRSRENARMDSIFLGSELTVSSSVAKNVSDGLFLPRPCRSPSPLPLDIWQKKTSRPRWIKGRMKTRAVFRDWLQDDMEFRGPVHNRGWTLQEQLLSTRMLYFGQGLLRWECLCASVTEADPASSLGRNGYLMDKADNYIAQKSLIRGMPPQSILTFQEDVAVERFHIYTAWQSQLEEFTRRQLNIHSDRLLALSALAQYVAKKLDDEFVAGLWKGDHLLESLCWRMKQPAVGGPRLPSWTWALVSGEISFKYLDQAGRHPGMNSRANLVSFDVKVDPISHLGTGTISLKGKLHSMDKLQAHSWSFDSLQTLPDASSSDGDLSNQGDGSGGESSSDVSWFCDFSHSLDYKGFDLSKCQAFEILEFPLGPPHEGYGYPIWPNGRPPAIVFLLLEPVEQRVGSFRRVGIASMELANFSNTLGERFPNIEGGIEQIITLV